MRLSRSGEYRLPGFFVRLAGNCLLPSAGMIPASLQSRYLANYSPYQVSSPDADSDYQGVSEKKWDALPMPLTMQGKSVLDIGCSEGFFARQCAGRGASPVVAVDGSLGRLLAARFLSEREGLKIRFKLGLFPQFKVRGPFDVVLCLSVLHHSFANKDCWKVLTSRQCEDDLQLLRSHLRLLRRLTAVGGMCIIEMPYEYDEPAEERKVVDFGVFQKELIAAGFASAKCQGTWEYNPEHVRFKDRIIYVAES